MTDLAERLAAFGLKATEASILLVLDEKPSITQSEIGRRLGIKRANMAPLIAGLVARELIVRGKTVGRMHPLTLTDRGAVLIVDVRAKMIEHDADFFGEFPPEHQAAIKAMLVRIWQKSA